MAPSSGNNLPPQRRAGMNALAEDSNRAVGEGPLCQQSEELRFRAWSTVLANDPSASESHLLLDVPSHA
jgi:hypothetical protein